MAVEVTEETVDQKVGASPVPVVLEFFASWCGDCRRVAPVLDKLAEEFAATVKFVEVNADESPGLVERFGVSSTPTLFVLDRGQQVASMVGAQPEPMLRGLFEAAANRIEGGRSELAWVPADACTLPTADRPTRLAEFEGLFASLRGLRREEPGWLRLRLDDGEGIEEQARALTAREAGCCSFFDFAVQRQADEVVVDVRVPASRVVVLDGLTAQAEAAYAARV
ncbi:thioredoxin family protein [Pseudonocardia humida]|uniref:Conjugal transfer protein TraF n=1 Tax=Pseudonocardia humida TaxID=2800819 RepID=A0ABT1AAJ4_9PSEU|nr:thioredoxin domain-containing protein [Pseudonocardia humida]MCO1659958.1 conjugal transfer protein TraF [Pseudonocardia humida]